MNFTFEAWQHFLELPIATLTEFGVNPRHVHVLERRYGLYFRSIQHVTPEEFLRIPTFARKTLTTLQQAMLKVLTEVEEDLRCPSSISNR